MRRAALIAVKAGLICSTVIGIALMLTNVYWREGLKAHGVPNCLIGPMLAYFFYATVFSFAIIPVSQSLKPQLRISYWYFIFTLINVMCIMGELHYFLMTIS